MIQLRQCGARVQAAVFAVGGMAALACSVQAAAPVFKQQPTPPASSTRDASLSEYRQHLQSLIPVVDACAKERDAKTCDPALAGPDDRVPSETGPHFVRFDWLRILLLQAQHSDADAAKAAREKQGTAPAGTFAPDPTTNELLQDAKKRLVADIEQTGETVAAASPHAPEQAVLQQVLAGKDFRSLRQTIPTDSLLEKVGAWVNSLFAKAGALQARAAWLGRMLTWGFILAVCTVLAWALLRLERRGKSYATEEYGPAPGAVSVRDWRLWLEDARRAAAQGQWRDAVHFTYWASVAYLEAHRLWPADRARTPREYLALVAADDPRKAGLTALTGGFERIWYGGRPAAESDYRRIETLAAGLIEGTAPAGSAKGSA